MKMNRLTEDELEELIALLDADEQDLTPNPNTGLVEEE